ncbi:cell division protein FtsA [Bacteroidia bacterium]|nr:cell division protein FtsA [Bacteroidia bacterium]
MEGYVAAIDLGTSKMQAMAARKNSLGELEVLGTEVLPLGDCMCRGRISKLEEATTKVQSVVNSLSRQPLLVQGLKQIYIGIGGQSLHTEPYTVKKEINGTVTRETLDLLEKECWSRPETWKIVSQQYYLDDVSTPYPVGEFCKEIEMRCLLVLARPFIEERNRLEQILSEKTQVEIADFFVSPLATAEAVLMPEQKESGIALVEIGAALTYVSIYKGSYLKFLVTIPLGGDVITKDLATLGKANIEEFKQNNGVLLDEPADTETTENKIIKARALEISANTIHQIHQSGYKSDLKKGGIILTGGGAQLKDFDRLLATESGLPVHLAPLSDQTQACVRGLVLSGKENCAGEVRPIEPPVVEVVEETNAPAAPIFEKPEKPEKLEEPDKPEKPKKTKKQGWGERLTRGFVGNLFDLD